MIFFKVREWFMRVLGRSRSSELRECIELVQPIRSWSTGMLVSVDDCEYCSREPLIECRGSVSQEVPLEKVNEWKGLVGKIVSFERNLAWMVFDIREATQSEEVLYYAKLLQSDEKALDYLRVSMPGFLRDGDEQNNKC